MNVVAKWTLSDAENLRANLTKQQENEISLLYRRVYLNTRQQMLAIPKDGTTSQKIQRQYLDKLHKQLDEAYKSLGIGLEKKIAKEAKKVAEGVVEEAKAFAEGLGLTVEGAFSRVPQDVVNSLVTGQVYGGSWSLSGAIWADVNKHQSDIGKVIAEGVAANKGAYEIAKDLEKYVDPKAKKPWDWSKVYPGTAKKVDYSAQRLARTMVSHAYQQSLERVCKNNPFVTGFIWQAAHSSRVCPICADRDGEFFKKGELPLDHPNGMCTFIASIEGSMDDVADRIADWVQGKEDSALDGWVKDLSSQGETMINAPLVTRTDYKTLSQGRFEELSDTHNQKEITYGKSGVEGYIGTPQAFKINEALRTGVGVENYASIIQSLDSAIESNSLPMNSELLRLDTFEYLKATFGGASTDSVSKHIGSIFESEGYMSTSFAISQNMVGRSGRNVLVRTLCDKGTKAYATQNYYEGEVVLPRGLKYELVDVIDHSKSPITLETTAPLDAEDKLEFKGIELVIHILGGTQ